MSLTLTNSVCPVSLVLLRLRYVVVDSGGGGLSGRHSVVLVDDLSPKVLAGKRGEAENFRVSPGG